MGFERVDDLLNGVTADGSLHGVAATVEASVEYSHRSSKAAGQA